MTDVPQWALERAQHVGSAVVDALRKACATGKLNAPETEVAILNIIARALAEAAPGWRTGMENAPKDRPILLRGRTSVGAPMVPIVVSWRMIGMGYGWVSAETGRHVGELLAYGGSEWADLPAAPEVKP